MKEFIPIHKFQQSNFWAFFIDPSLNFKFHTSHISLKISKALYFLRNSKNILSQKGLKSLYYSLIHCHLVYANLIWGSVKQSNLKKIFIKQKAAVRLIASAPYNAHTEPIFKSLKILPLEQLCTFFRLQFFQQFKQGFVPAALKSIWLKNSDRLRESETRYNLRNSEDLQTYTSRLSQYDQFPLYSIPTIWSNFQDENIKIIRDIPSFNFQLKQFLLGNLNSNYICNRLLCPHCHINNIH